MMLVADGVMPSNEGRGYVLRRILRRAIRNLRLLGAGDERYMHELTAVAIEVMGEQYPELKADAAADPRGHRRRGGVLPRHAPHRHRDLRRGGRGDQAQVRQRTLVAATRPSSCTTPTASRST